MSQIWEISKGIKEKRNGRMVQDILLKHNTHGSIVTIVAERIVKKENLYVVYCCDSIVAVLSNVKLRGDVKLLEEGDNMKRKNMEEDEGLGIAERAELEKLRAEKRVSEYMKVLEKAKDDFTVNFIKGVLYKAAINFIKENGMQSEFEQYLSKIVQDLDIATR